MGSSVLKLLQTTWNFWLPSPVPSSEWLLPSPAMATTAMDTAMDTATATTSATAMDTMDTTARGRLMPSPAMDTTAMDTVTATDAATILATAMDTMDTTARGRLMLSPRLRLLPLLGPLRTLRPWIRLRSWTLRLRPP